MPLDIFDSHDYFYEKCRSKDLCWSVLPRKCYISGKLIWFSLGYKLTARYNAIPPQKDPIVEYRWFNRNEYIVAVLAGRIKWEH